MSLTGSPVVNHAEPKSGAHMYIPLGDGRVSLMCMVKLVAGMPNVTQDSTGFR